jgi:hypothetical protein
VTRRPRSPSRSPSSSRWPAATPSSAGGTSPASRWRCRLEFNGQDHAIGRELERVSEGLVKRVARLIGAGRRDGSIPPGPPARAVAQAFVGALEGTVIALAGQPPHDELLAARAVAGVLGLDSPPVGLTAWASTPQSGTWPAGTTS